MRGADETLRIGDLLVARFAQLRGTMDTSQAGSKGRTIVELARLFAERGVPYAVIGGVAVQIWSAEPRTTLDVDVAVPSYDVIPRDALRAAGFEEGGRFRHSSNWRGPDGTPVQFADDPAFAAAIAGAEVRDVGGVPLRVAPVLELVRAKLRAVRDAGRRRSKRLMDLADAAALAEQHPQVAASLSPADRELLGRDV